MENKRSQHNKIHIELHKQTKKYAILEQGIMDIGRNKKYTFQKNEKTMGKQQT